MEGRVWASCMVCRTEPGEDAEAVKAGLGMGCDLERGSDAWKAWHGKQPAHPAEIHMWIQCQEMKGHTSGDDQ